MLLSPLDWALIETWQERGVPLHIIVRGIEKVFDAVDKNPGQRRSVKSLMYCREEIEAQYSEWLESQTGKTIAVEAHAAAQRFENAEPPAQISIDSGKKNAPDATELFPDESVIAHLESVTAGLNAAKRQATNELRATLESVCRQLQNITKDFSGIDVLEENLEKLDAQIDESLLRAAEEDVENAKKEAENHLANYRRKMEADVYQKTIELMILKNLREQAEIPRLSLFYL